MIVAVTAVIAVLAIVEVSRNSAEERRTSAVVVPAFIADSMDFVIVSRMA
jgi:hypothetical protein